MLQEKKFLDETNQIFASDENSDSVEDKHNKISLELATSLFRTLKTAIIHNVDNVAMVRLIKLVVSSINKNIKEEGPVSIQQSDKKIFINKRIIVAGTSSYLILRDLAAIFDQRKIGGITFNKEVSSDDMKKFLTLFVSTPDRPELSYFDSLERSLKEIGLHHFILNRPLGISGGTINDDLSLNRGQMAHYLYARALIFMKKYIVNFDDEGLRSNFANKCVRTIQEIVDLCRNKSQYILGLISLKYFEEHFYHHSVNVAILSILLGQKIGIEKSQLAELGMCGLFHDIGLMNKMNAREKTKDSDNHSLYGVGQLIKEKNITHSLMRRIVVIYEHHFEYSKANIPERYKKYDLDLFSRIVQIVDTFDILTSDNGVHEPELPDRALAKMMELSNKKFDPALMKTFVNIVGIYPIGTPVILNTGEIAVVYHSNLDPSKFNKPQIKLVRNSDGSSLKGQIVDLDQQKDRFIERAVSPKNLGINVSHYLLN